MFNEVMLSLKSYLIIQVRILPVFFCFQLLLFFSLVFETKNPVVLFMINFQCYSKKLYFTTIYKLFFTIMKFLLYFYNLAKLLCQSGCFLKKSEHVFWNKTLNRVTVNLFKYSQCVINILRRKKNSQNSALDFQKLAYGTSNLKDELAYGVLLLF